jgi:hypothetical protein
VSAAIVVNKSFQAAADFDAMRSYRVDGCSLAWARASGAHAVSAIQSIRAKSATAMRKAQPTPSRDDDGDDILASPDDATENADAPVAPPPPGMGKLVDRSV